MLQSAESASGTHHPNLTSFADAAASGCYICAPLSKYVLRQWPTTEDPLVPYKYRVYDNGGHTQIFIDLAATTNSITSYDFRAFLVFPKSMLPASFNILNRQTSIPTSEAAEAARKWMNLCLHEHKQCQQHTQPLSYPTRLLDLGDAMTKLVLSAERKLSGPYAALSYCWGPNPNFLRLTTSNFRDLQAGVLYSDLPIAFRQAIQLIKGLSIRYVWIDSLCIIQSNSEDWQIECDRMQGVYSNSVLNLSLAQAAHPNETCMSGFNHNATPPFEVEITGLISSGESKEHTYTVIQQYYYQKAMYDQPIARRAWVLQERTLATRVLTIGLGELFWDCCQLTNASESLPQGLNDLGSSLGGPVNSIPQTSDGTVLERAWLRIVDDYTARELTYPEVDKLTALSAIADRMGRAMQDSYITGHFSRMMPRSLNWKVKTSQPEHIREDLSRRTPRRLSKGASSMKGGRQIKTPTWSWASIDGPINTFELRSNESQECVAKVVTFGLRAVDREDTASFMDNTLLEIQAYCTEIEWHGDRPKRPDIFKAWKDDYHWFTISIDDPEDQPTEGAKLMIASIVMIDYMGVLEGLVLKKTGSEEHDAYERIGHFELGISGKGDIAELLKEQHWTQIVLC